VLAETRGEGGWVVVAPSGGPTHETGRPWTVAYGSPATVPTITMAERDALHSAFRCLDQTPPAEPTPTQPRLSVVRTDGSVAPGDDYEARTSWSDILRPHGWTLVFNRGQVSYWRRPGKDRGVSATTGHAADRDRLYVFSSSTEFEQEHPYTKFGAYVLLEHDGDYTAAARALRGAGYGTPTPLAGQVQAEAIADLLPPNSTTAARVLASVDGTAARVLAEPAPEPARFGPTEDGMARALVAHHEQVLRYCPQRGKWLRWEGHRWAWDDAETHRELIRAMVRGLPDADGWTRFKQRAMSAAGVSGIERLARSDRAVTVAFDQLDGDPWALNTPAGVIDLRTGKVGASDPAALHTRSTSAIVDPAADPATWTAFLATTFGGDANMIGYLQRLVGYSAVGMIGPHILPFCFGSGGNGKGAFLEAVTGVLGDYATSAPVGFLMAQTHSGHETEIARLAGARMVLCSEVNEDDRFDEAKVKQLTGGDTLTARFMRQDHFTFTPTHQLWLMGNHQPAVRSGGRSFWRRLRLVPFLHEVPESEVIDDLQGLLVREHGAALLAWIVAGAVAYAEGGLREPDSVKSATAAYERDQDTVRRFVDDCCHLGGGPAVTIKIGAVREAYEAWCGSGGETPVSAKAFGMALQRMGVESTKGAKGTRMYAGVTLLTDENAPPGDEDAPPDAPPGEWYR
jgi:putative DNA primase/helicase